MSSSGELERATQNRVVKLFAEQLGYRYLGNWSEREGNSNIEENILWKFLSQTQGYSDTLITRAML